MEEDYQDIGDGSGKIMIIPIIGVIIFSTIVLMAIIDKLNN